MKLIEQYRNMEAQANSFLRDNVNKTFNIVSHDELVKGEWERFNFFKIATITVPCKRRGKAIKTREEIVVLAHDSGENIVEFYLNHIPLEKKLLICNQFGL